MGNCISKAREPAVISTTSLRGNSPSAGLAHSVEHAGGDSVRMSTATSRNLRPEVPAEAALITHANTGPSKPERSKYTNPALDKKTRDGKHQYTLDNENYGDAYSTKEVLRTLGVNIGDVHELLGEGYSNKVYKRINPNSRFIKKVSQLDVDRALRESSMEITNKIAKLVNRDPVLKPHFVVEVLKEINGERATFLAPAVNGFTLNQYFKNRRFHTELPVDMAISKLKNLKRAILVLAAYGFVQPDAHVENVMFDRDMQEFVLIDFEEAMERDEDSPNAKEEFARRLQDCLDFIGEHENRLLNRIGNFAPE